MKNNLFDTNDLHLDLTLFREDGGSTTSERNSVSEVGDK